ncbi:NHL repeat-containing protein [Leptospira terpstrae]|uniref:NHL repeat protein n=1 Tax=Leptospira terpstrae serovar Hualin str. LT 11-33 = ATCC 700639 TaxID=1257025 RepID=N1VQP8_9LEPT|nr:NHL repeat-containing protein [Leptospira terpstrae]EMY62054.1 hypothetical protein LEP1GSC203_3607 [Leptospira terpstrae serovar Hualin str. LT 11-33 = ATCC 700639]
MKLNFSNLTIILLFLLLFFINCKPEFLNNQCDIKSDSFYPTLIFQSVTTAVSQHCGYNLVNIPPFGYKFPSYRLYLNFPVSIIPRNPMNSSYSIQGNLPQGLTFDGATGEIRGIPTTISPASQVTITKSSPGFGITSILIQVVDTSPTTVYGQYGFYTCSNTYNNGSCTPGSATNQNFSFPYGVIADSSGGVYISGVNRIQYYPPNTTASTKVYGQFGVFTCDIANVVSAGSCAGTAVTANSLNGVRGLALDSNDGLYAVDTANHRVLHYPKDSFVPTVAYGQTGFSSALTGAPTATSMNTPLATAYAADGGIYVSESANHRILYFPPGSTTASRVYGQTNFVSNSTGIAADKMSSPYGISLDSEGGMYVADSGNSRVLYFPAGSTSATRVYGQPDFGTNGGGPGATGLSGATWVALDQSDNLFVADTGNNRVVMYPRTTQTAGIAAIAVFGQFNDLNCSVTNNGGTCNAGVLGPKSLSTPTGIFFNQLGQLYIADRGNNRVLMY